MIVNRFFAPTRVRNSERWRGPWKGLALRVRVGPRSTERDRWHLGPGGAQRRRRLLRFGQRGREVLAERAVGRMRANAVRSRCRLDVRIGARAHGIPLEPRIGDGHHRWQHELQDGGYPPQDAREARRSVHSGRLGLSQSARHRMSRELTIPSYPPPKRAPGLDPLQSPARVNRSRSSANAPASAGR